MTDFFYILARLIKNKSEKAEKEKKIKALKTVYPVGIWMM